MNDKPYLGYLIAPLGYLMALFSVALILSIISPMITPEEAKCTETEYTIKQTVSVSTSSGFLSSGCRAIYETDKGQIDHFCGKSPGEKINLTVCE